MRSAETDLSGRWAGFYNYPGGGEPCPFEADIRDSGGVLSGVTSEPGDRMGLPEPIVHAVLDGRHSGTAVGFTKIYDRLDLAPDPIRYEGTLAEDEDEIEGRWTIAGLWSGTFLMVRNRGAAEAATVGAGERMRV